MDDRGIPAYVWPDGLSCEADFAAFDTVENMPLLHPSITPALSNIRGGEDGPEMMDTVENVQFLHPPTITDWCYQCGQVPQPHFCPFPPAPPRPAPYRRPIRGRKHMPTTSIFNNTPGQPIFPAGHPFAHCQRMSSQFPEPFWGQSEVEQYDMLARKGLVNKERGGRDNGNVHYPGLGPEKYSLSKVKNNAAAPLKTFPSHSRSRRHRGSTSTAGTTSSTTLPPKLSKASRRFRRTANEAMESTTSLTRADADDSTPTAAPATIDPSLTTPIIEPNASPATLAASTPPPATETAQASPTTPIASTEIILPASDTAQSSPNTVVASKPATPPPTTATNTNPVYARLCGIAVHQFDVEPVRDPEGWLSDPIINGWGELRLKRAIEDQNLHPSVLCSVYMMAPAMATWYRTVCAHNLDDSRSMEENREALETAFKEDKETNMQLKSPWIFVPVNDGDGFEGTDSRGSGTHWSLLVFDMVNNVCWNCDSWGNMNGKPAHLLHTAMQVLTGRDIATRFIEAPQQSNTWDCGVFVCWFLDILINAYVIPGTPLHPYAFDPYLNANLIWVYRAWIEEVIDEHRIPEMVEASTDHQVFEDVDASTDYPVLEEVESSTDHQVLEEVQAST